jgi:hypothetical protein
MQQGDISVSQKVSPVLSASSRKTKRSASGAGMSYTLLTPIRQKTTRGVVLAARSFPVGWWAGFERSHVFTGNRSSRLSEIG